MRIPLRMRLTHLSMVMCLYVCVPAHGLDSVPVEAGYQDFSYGAAIPTPPTADKPQSKLWFNDGTWWGALYSPAAARYEIFRLDAATQSWVSSGVPVDNRGDVHMDVLWAGQYLYVVSGSAMLDGLLLRYTYSAATQQYALDSGFPVTVRTGGAETISIARDSTGKLWVTYPKNKLVQMRCTAGSDTVWGQTFTLPTQATTITSDDIPAIIHFNGDRIGVMWSDQAANKFFFSVHVDGSGDNSWLPAEAALPGPSDDPGKKWADDHINLKQVNGRVFAAVKTSLGDTPSTGVVNPDDPLNMLLVRDTNGQWTSAAFGAVRDHHTRAIVQIDEEHGVVHLFATAPETNGQIYRKSCPLGDVRFTLGRGTPFIQSSQDTTIGNATSTKQNLTGATGLVVLASDATTLRYLHNAIPLTDQFFNTLSPVADAQVRGGQYADNNYGSSTVIEARTTDVADGQRDSYMKFDLAGLAGIPFGALLRVQASTGTGDPVGIGAYGLTDTTWIESSVTWNTRPFIDYGSGPLATATISGIGYLFYDLNVLSHVQAQLNTQNGVNSLISFGLHNPVATSTQVRILSRERTPVERPRLEINCQAPMPLPFAPKNLVAAAQSGAINLSWVDNSANESSFVLERQVDGGAFSPLAELPANTSAYADTTVQAGHSFAYRVQAVNAAGASSWSTSNPITLVAPPSAPSNLTASAKAAGKKANIAVKWTDTSTNETGFVLQRSTNSDFTANVASIQLAANATSYQDTNLALKTTYYYRIQSVNMGGQSAWTGTAVVTTP